MPNWNTIAIAASALGLFAAPAFAGGKEGQSYRNLPAPVKPHAHAAPDCVMGKGPDGTLYKDCGQGWVPAQPTAPRKHVSSHAAPAPSMHIGSTVRHAPVVTSQYSRFSSTCSTCGPAPVIHRPAPVRAGLTLSPDTVGNFFGGVGYNVQTEVFGGGGTIVTGGGSTGRTIVIANQTINQSVSVKGGQKHGGKHFGGHKGGYKGGGYHGAKGGKRSTH